jgi:hypothetical protein
MKGPIALVIALALAFGLPIYFFGYAFGTVTGLVLTASFLLILGRYTSWLDMIKIIPKTKTAGYAGIGLLFVTFLMTGAFGLPQLVPFTWESLLGGFGGGATFLAAPMGQQEASVAATQCAAGFTDEQLDESASVNLFAYDMESSTGRTSPVDLTTNCWLFANGNSADHFVKKSADTEDAATTGAWNVGDAAFIYCGGTSYYTDPVEGECINGPNVAIEFDTHAIVTATTGLVIAGFDKNMNALTAAGNTSTADYDVTLGASESEKIYVELTQNTADKAYNLGALAMDTWNDIDSIKPTGESAALFDKVTTPDYLDSVTVSSDESGGATANVTLTYEVYKLKQPVMLHEWDSVTYALQIKAGSTDPTASDTDFDGFDGAVVCFLDQTYSRGVDGTIYYDIHSHAEEGSEADVGLSNEISFPVQKDDCVVFEGA